jgi:imidazolonepropionase-like amidohydrolase
VAELSVRPDGSVLAFTNARLIDGTGAAARPHATVVTRHGRIESVGFGPGAIVPPDAKEIDVGGRTLIPGLIDAHAHIGNVAGIDRALSGNDVASELVGLALGAVAGRLLAGGITTVRELGAVGDRVLALRDAIRLGLLRGPRILASGRIMAATSPGARAFPGMYREANGPDDMRRAVREQIRRGADLIKVMVTGALTVLGENVHPAQMTAAEFGASIDEAHRMGLRVATHAEGLEGIRLAVDGGADTIEHGEFAHRDPSLLARMAERGTVLVPTLSVFHLLTDPETAPAWPASLVEQAKGLRDAAYETVAAARRAGVVMAMGPDAGPQGGNSRELIRLVAAGLHPLEAITAGTRNGALACGTDEFGTIAKGRAADLLVVDGDPTADIAVLTDAARRWLVVRDGELVAGMGLRQGVDGAPRSGDR